MESNCPMCRHSGVLFYEDKRHRFFSCTNCNGLFRDPAQFPEKKLEKERYLLHENSMQDKGYLQFAGPILEAVRSQVPPGALGLDYGCGHTPVISRVLEKEGYDFSLYDPFFYPDQGQLEQCYDFVTCCEVIEHFHEPKKEFELLHGLLPEGGKLFCMTYPFEQSIDFGSWHYKNDPTHVFIYTLKTLLHIKENIVFQDVKVEGRLITFIK